MCQPNFAPNHFRGCPKYDTIRTMTGLTIIDHQRENLLNAVVYFVRNTKHCHTLKLLKLLNFLDFEHYRQTGKTVTGLSYKALPMGPVPVDFLEELKNPPADLALTINIVEHINDLNGQIARRDLKARKKFNEQFFTKREIKIMERLALFFSDLQADDMSEFSHEPKLPWRKVYRKGKGAGEVIPYELAFESYPFIKEQEAINLEDLAWLRFVHKDFGMDYS